MQSSKSINHVGDDLDEQTSTMDQLISNTTDLPNFFVQPNSRSAAMMKASEEEAVANDDLSSRTYDSVCSENDEEKFDLAGGELIQDDVHTLVRNPKAKTPFARDSGIRESMVGMKEGVPGIFSGFERKQKHYSKLKRSGSDPSASDTQPVRPPRRSKGQSVSKIDNDDDYDKLWGDVKDKTDDYSDHEYSLLGEIKDNPYDEVEKEDLFDTRTAVISSSPVKDKEWLMTDNEGEKKRPLSTVVLPISPIEDASESDSASDWGSEFDDSYQDYHDGDDDDIYEVIGDVSQKMASNRDSVYQDLNAVRTKTAEALRTSPHKKGKPLPPLPPPPRIPSTSDSFNAEDEEAIHYVDIGLNGSNFAPPRLPILDADATEEEVKRYQIIKFVLENEAMYTKSINKLIQEYERPLKEKRIINADSVKIIFQNLHEIEQCHQLFNIALCGRMTEWNSNQKIGDIVYASFSKSMVLKAYSNYTNNFTKAMEHVKETCRSVPAFLNFLRARLSRSKSSQTFYDLLKKPLGRFPQLVVLLQELLKVSPVSHPDRMPLQMALTHLECLSELICEKRRDIEMKYRVSQLDRYFVGLSKPLFSHRRYYIRHDDMYLCKISDGQVVKKKLRRLFLLSDLLVCASIINKSNAVNKLSRKRYHVKWCVPVAEVDVVDMGSGIFVNINNKVTTIKYTHPVSSPRPGAKKMEESLEALQHDLAVIGQISALVSSLRKSYDVIDEKKIGEWYRDVKDTIDKETELANMHWLELSLPAKDKKTMTCLFKLNVPQQKLEWTTELDNAKLRLAYDNNPGWYIQEDETASSESMGILRRNLPLLGNKIPLFMVETKLTIEYVLEVTPHGSTKPILWIFSGNEHTGQITLMEMSMSSVPHVIESFVACGARILAAEVVKDELNRFGDPIEQKTLVWCGTMSGSIHVFNASSENDHEEVAVARLRDSVLCFKHIQNKVFCGIANGTLACFRLKADGSWDYENPTIVCLGTSAVMDLAEAGGKLWCACGNSIFIIDIDTLGIEHRIEVNENTRATVRHLVSYGTGVWASLWKTSMLHLYHAETFDCLQSISVTTPLTRMKNDIDSRLQSINTEKIYITSMLARGGLLWVGTDSGVIITYPLPRLGGIPLVSGRPSISFHGHQGPVRCLHAFKVERNFRRRGDTNDVNSGVARSLFYVDPFDEAASGLNIPAAMEDVSTTKRNKSPDPSLSSEPFYFTVLPENTPKSSTEQTASNYEDWLKSFGTDAKNVDPLFVPESQQNKDPKNYYDSEDSIDSDTEFSFIEDRGKPMSTKAKKNAMSFSVDIKQPSGDNEKTVGTVRVSNGDAGLSVIKESDFAQMLDNFSGFVPKAKTEMKQPEKSVSKSESVDETEFVIVGKSESGYEEPVPAPGKVVTDPYAKVLKQKSVADDSSNSGNVEPVTACPEPSQEDIKKYRDEPLPELPVKTLYETAREWSTLEREKMNASSFLSESDLALDSFEREVKSINVESKEELSRDTSLSRSTLSNEAANLQSGKGSSQIETDTTSALQLKSREQSKHAEFPHQIPYEGNKDTSSVPARELQDIDKAPTDDHDVEKTSEEGSGLEEDNIDKQIESQRAEKSQVDGADMNSVSELQDDVDSEIASYTENASRAELFKRNLKSPLCIKLTDLGTQSTIEGSVNADGVAQIERKDSFLPDQHRTDMSTPNTATGNEKEPSVGELKAPSGAGIDASASDSTCLPTGDAQKSTDEASQNSPAWTLPPGRRQVSSQIDTPPGTPATRSLPSGFAQRPQAMQTPKNLDLTSAKDLETAESIYTPLLNQTEQSSVNSFSGVGVREFETDMALSTSLARETQHQGYYASLVSVSNRDNETRRELFMRPVYVLSVGGGYLDLRKKQKLGSGLEFFKNLTASEPDPKMLIWKITS